jgi:transcription antitermination factor NusG
MRTSIEKAHMNAMQAVSTPSGHNFESGDAIEITNGPLAGLQGVYVEKRLAFRCVVTVVLQESTIHAEIGESWIVPVPTPECS